MSVSGRVENMVGNITAGGARGLDHGSSGLLVTDWGDMGHLQYLPVSEPGLATAAAAGWCGASHDSLDLDGLAETLDVHAFDDPDRADGYGTGGPRSRPPHGDAAPPEHLAGGGPSPSPPVAASARGFPTASRWRSSTR